MNEETEIPNNLEIDKALKEFEMKSGAEQIPKASEVSKDSGIKFEEDKWKQSIPSFQDETPKMVRWVMKISGGAIQEQRQAEYVLLGLVILMFVVSFYLFFGGGPSRPTLSPQDLILTPPFTAIPAE